MWTVSARYWRGSQLRNGFNGVPADATLLSPTGTVLQSNSYAWYFKLRKHFHHGDDSFGAYLAKGVAYKPYDIPVFASQATINGSSGGYLWAQHQGRFDWSARRAAYGLCQPDD